MIYGHQQIVEPLGIDLDRFFHDLETSVDRQLLSDRDKEMVCRFLLGFRRKQIADAIHLSDC